MKIISVKKSETIVLKQVARQLKRGAVIVYPTDTAYGLGCDATNAKAVARIFAIKGRAAKKALPLICADIKMVKKYFGIVHCPLSIVHKHWPGPLSIILKAKGKIAKAALEQGTAAVRVPNSAIARQLAKFLGRPLVATSANLSGQPACYSVRAFLQQFANPAALSLPSPHSASASRGEGMEPYPPLSGGGWPQAGRGRRPDIVLDAGALSRRKPSTIIRIDKSGTIEVLRQGPVKLSRHPEAN